ncbi:transporter substrate-binding domain-containing protein [Gallaecimonas sp. GXIMD4217]|uniref:substrate-binding periplasmic protein n=1 Tax=Gallaecimonas sp. GXIMD4217 TaxID=3131927 RepID=UPI00311AE9DF
MRILLLLCCLCSLPLGAEEPLRLFTEQWKPISYTEGGRPTGLAVEVVADLQRRLGKDYPIEVVPWVRGWNMMRQHPNVVLFAMTRTSAREKLFTLLGPIASGTIDLYAVKDSDIVINSLDDARRFKRIGVYRGAVEEQLLTERGFTNLEDTTYPLQSAKKLMVGRIELWCTTSLTMPSLLEQAGFDQDDVKSLYQVADNHLYIAFSRGTPKATIDAWQQALEASKADGSFARIYQKWLPGMTPPARVERLGSEY